MAGYVFLYILALGICISKAAVNITNGVALLLSLIYVVLNWKSIDFKEKYRYIPVLLFPFAYGLFASFFALGGASSVAAYFERYRFFLMIPAVAFFAGSEKRINNLFIALNVSAFASLAFSVYLLQETDFVSKFISGEIILHVKGFHNLIRGADMLAVVCVMNIASIFMYKHAGKKKGAVFNAVIVLNTVFMVIGIIAMGRRGAMLGLAAGCFVLIFMMRRGYILALAIIAGLFTVYYSNTWVKSRMASVLDIKNDVSNITRLQLMVSGRDFIVSKRLVFKGTGAKKSRELFDAYFNSMPEPYRKKNLKALENSGNFHNSFLQMAIENGMVFLGLFLLSNGYVLAVLVKKSYRIEKDRRIYPVTGAAVTVSCFVSQFFYKDLYMYTGILFILAMTTGCAICNSHMGNEDGGGGENDGGVTEAGQVLYGPEGPVFHKA
jgi:hypothetical protein